MYSGLLPALAPQKTHILVRGVVLLLLVLVSLGVVPLAVMVAVLSAVIV
jgi:hypothetical protein